MNEAQPIQLDQTLALDEANLDIFPNGWYCDSAAFRLEQEEIIARTWQYAGPAGMVSKPGRFVTDRIGHLPVIISRGEDGELHAMANVCQHRGSVVADGHGHCKQFKCPYHGWTYGLDGTLVNPLGLEREIDRSAFSLPKLQTTEWGPFLFVGPRDLGESIDHFYDPLPERLKQTGLSWESMLHYDRRSWEIQANWKVVTENYIECYHCGHVHPDYAKYVDMSNYSWEYGNFYEAQAGPAHPAAFKEGYLTPDDAITDGLFVHTWPNFHIQVYPGDAHNISALQIRPVGPNRTVALLDHYFGQNTEEDEATRITEMFAQQLEEDWAICERVQEGLESGAYRAGRTNMDGYRPGRLNLQAAPGRTEDPIQHFHRLLHAALNARQRMVFGNGLGRGDVPSGNGHAAG